MTASVDGADELMHPVGDDPAWSESYYFNFVDPDSKIAMFSRMGFRPNNGWADGLHVVYLGGDRVAFTYGRRAIEADLAQYSADLQAGDLRLVCDAPFERWQICYDGPAQDIADAAILLERRKARPEGWFDPADLSMNIEFAALTEPHYAAMAAAGGNSPGKRGHFEQSGRFSGSIKLGEETWQVAGYGVRDKSWGPRDWGASTQTSGIDRPATTDDGPAPFVNWFSMNFGPDIALGGACGRAADGEMRGQGWYQEDGTSTELNNVHITTQYKADSIWHTNVHLTAETGHGKPLDIHGRVLTVCPTKIAMPGGATFVNEGLAEFTMAERTGYGIAEHWHAIKTAPA
ncbi:MAG: hypothetical protein OES38_18690 [Gammaproteobacteria bacterium]|nr:hypothetical protein [Gammaproteobacteria bacterium]